MPVYQEIWAGPGRNYKRLSNGEPLLAAKWYITVHNTSNNATASGEAIYAKIRPDGVGSHYYADSTQVLQSTDTDRCVGHVGSTQGNTRGLAYEITGFNGWTRAEWLANVAWDKLAAAIARDCRHFGIPVRLLTITQMQAYRADVKGFVTHDMCRLAWGGTTHTDPGPGFPMDHLLTLVSQHMTGGPFMALTEQEQDDLYRRVCNLDHFIFKGNAQGLESIDDLKFGLGEGKPVPPQPYELTRKINELLARPPAQAPPVDQAAINAAVLAAMTNPAVLAAIAEAVRPVVDSELDEAFTGAADKD